MRLQEDEDTTDMPAVALTYDFLGAAWAVGIVIDPGDLLLQTGPHACIWRVRNARHNEEGGSMGYRAQLVEEGAGDLSYALEALRADGVSGPNGGPLGGVYAPYSLERLREKVAMELAKHSKD
jgi:hypothetical protein